ncbi:MAG: cytochrome P450 [Alphaproteobacteria bacterium]|nr:cytochrome P450 [Alphaproteobacteria bacterium]
MMDLNDPETFSAGHPARAYDVLRRTPGLVFNPEREGPGFWAVTRHADVLEVDRDFSTFSSSPTIMIADPGIGESGLLGEAQMMLMMDPPQHTAFRKLIRAAFTKDQADGRGGRLAELAREIVDAVISRGECDFVADIAGEMPSFVIAELMGLPRQDGRELYKLTEIIHSAPEAVGVHAGRDAVMKMFAYGMEVIAQKRVKPADDLASLLLSAEVEGRRLTDPEFLLFFLLLIDAGGDTTRNLLASGLIALLDHPDQMAWLRADLGSRLPTAREELLRYTSPVIYMRRTATRATRLGETEIAKGDKVVMYFGAANRDPDVFDHPETLDLARDDNPHLAFGGGPHHCLGRHIARQEIDAVLCEVLSRLDDLALAAPPVWLASTFISGPKTLPVRFRAA